MKGFFLGFALLAAPVLAQPAPSFLEERGTLSSEQLLADLNAQLAPEQRAQLDAAVQKRNAALKQANEELNATLRQLLRTSDSELSKRLEDETEKRRLERMKRLQPARYRELMNRRKNAGK